MSKNKLATVIALCLMISMTVSLIALPVVSAHNPPVNVPTFVYVAVAPNPVGLNQAATLVLWSAQAPPDAASDPSIRWHFDLSVTNPNGNVTSLGKFTSNVAGQASTTFTPDMVGTWNVTVKFPATLYGWDATAEQQVWTGDTFSASSYTASFVVQSETVPEPLPVDYYSRGDWFKVTSNWEGTSSPQTGGITGRRINDDATGPTSSHIMWTKPLENGGIVGGQNVGVPGDQFYTGLSYSQRFTSYFIMDGKLYYREPSGSQSGQSSGFLIVDLRNGERLLRTTVTSLGMGYSANGVTCFFSSSSYGDALGTDTLQPLGWSISGVPSGTTMLGPSGEHLRVSIVNEGTDGPEYHVRQWNSSKVIKPGLIGDVDASSDDFIDFDVPITYNGQPFELPDRSILAAFVDDHLVTARFSRGSGSSSYSYAFWTISLKPEDRGSIIANYTFTRLNNGTGQYINTDCVDPINHVIAIAYKETRSWSGVNYLTGEVFGPTESQADLDYYGDMPNLALGTEHDMGGWVKYGKLYTSQYGGILYCYDMKNMSLLWTYGNGGPGNTTSLGLGAIWGHSPTFVGGIANGLVYLYTNEHSPNTPIYKGAKIRCVDAETGEELWTLPGFSGAFTSMPSFIPPANGFLVYLNSYDQQIYALAKGPSATTVSAASEVVQGDKIIIEGTVLDICAGTRQNEQAGRFPNGLAAVSDDSMDVWMEYVYANRPRPDVTGVDVTLTAIGPDGSSQQIGVATSTSTGYYNFVFEPQAVGSYTVVADFAGSDAYYPSNAQTSFTVAAAPEPPVVEPEPAPLTDTYILGATAGIIIAIAVIGAVVILIIRRS